MPRLRCHWGVLARVAAELRVREGGASVLVTEHRGEYFAGGVAPDALRLLAGHDKSSSHFYDDQRPETWDSIPAAIAQAHPEVADPQALPPETRAWMAGYLTHILTDVAYWRHVMRILPRFPQHIEAHLGAWLLADSQPIPQDERVLDLDRIRFDAAPSWIDTDAVRAMLERMTARILVPDGMWPVELAYIRVRGESAGRSDEELLQEHVPSWETSLACATPLLPPPIWENFIQDAIAGSVAAVETYLEFWSDENTTGAAPGGGPPQVRMR